MTPRRAFALTWIAATIAAILLNTALPPPFGLSAMPAIFEPYLVVIALIAAVAVVRTPGPGGLLLIVVLVAIALLRYAPSWVSFASAPTSETIRISTWNMHAGPNAADRALDGVSTSSAQILAMHELGPEAVAALDGLDDRFRYAALTSNTTFLD